MGLSIKNEEVERRVRQLAERTGMGVTEAIDDAVTRRLKELDHDVAAELARINAALAEIHAKFGPFKQEMIWSDDDIYDENGLPK